ncbi:hypothetical protein PENSPDRAFT_335649 [Peniophora sp. CONT]|nr:hypothetical protein PENSPDRAFT_335649 [Peniophora sp. CONT]
MTFYTSPSPQRDQMYATVPLKNRHYEEKRTLAGLLHGHDMPIAAHMTNRCPAHGWTSFYSPSLEGKLYYTQCTSIRLITEANLMDVSTAWLVDACARYILNWALELYPDTITPTVELFLDPNAGTGRCGYYFVDHDARQIFWLTTTSINRFLGLPLVCSGEKLYLVMKLNYWRHLEMFGEHLNDIHKVLDEFVELHLYGRDLDLERILHSRFSLSRGTLEGRLSFLQTQPNATVLPYLAMLWGSIISEQLLQLNDDDHVSSRSSYSVPFRIISAVMFRCPIRVRLALEDEHAVDEAGLRDIWMDSVASHVAKWQVLVQCILGLMNLPSALAEPGPNPVPVLTRISLALGLFGLLVTVFYENCFDDMLHNGNRACNFIRSMHRTKKTAVLAILLSVPRAVFIWSVILFNIQAFAPFFCGVPLSISIPFCAMLICFVVAVYWIHASIGGYQGFSGRLPWHFIWVPQFVQKISFSWIRRRQHPPEQYNIV